MAGRAGRYGSKSVPRRVDRLTTKSGWIRRPWGIVVIILGVVLAGSVGWYLLHTSSNSPSSKIQPKIQTVEPSAPISTVETSWLPADWEQLNDEKKIEFIKKEELSQAEALAATFVQNEDALVVLGNVYRKYGNSAQALVCWEKALAINPNRVDAFDGMAMVAMEKGEHDRAAELWNKAILIQPNHPEYRCYRAQALSRGGRQEEAIQSLQDEIRRFPFSGLAHYLLGQEYLQRKEYAAAKGAFETAVARMPSHTGSYYGLMTACLRMNLAADAKRYKARFDELKARDIKDTRDAIRGQDDFQGMWGTAAETYLVAEALYRKTGDLSRAQSALLHAELIDPDHPQLLKCKAEAYRSRGQLSEALALHEKIAQTKPDDILNLFNMAGICIEIKQYGKAQTALETAIAHAPGFDGAYRELARLFLAQGREFARARKLAARAVELSPVAANYFVLSWACDKTGDRAGAVAGLKRSVELEPENPLYQEKFRLSTMQE